MNKDVCARIIWYAVSLFFISISAQIPDQRSQFIDQCVHEKFDDHLPGLAYELRHLNNSGSLFELESGLYAQECLEARVYGFKLEFSFLEGYNTIQENSRTVLLADTEFDIVTDTWVIECKGFYDGEHAYEWLHVLDQIEKEQRMTHWLDALYEDILSGDVKVQYIVSKKGKNRFVIWGKLTGEKKVVVECSWVTGHAEQVCLKQFIEAVGAVANKEPIAFFRSPLGSYLRKEFKKRDFVFCDNIAYVGSSTIDVFHDWLEKLER
jgi:hypothetical protein